MSLLVSVPAEAFGKTSKKNQFLTISRKFSELAVCYDELEAFDSGFFLQSLIFLTISSKIDKKQPFSSRRVIYG